MIWSEKKFGLGKKKEFSALVYCNQGYAILLFD